MAFGIDVAISAGVFTALLLDVSFVIAVPAGIITGLVLRLALRGRGGVSALGVHFKMKDAAVQPRKPSQAVEAGRA